MEDVAFKPLDTTYGAVALSSFLSAALFGFTFLQTYTYFLHRSSNDALLMKLGVGLLWAVDCLQAFFMVWGVYWYLVQHFFQPSALHSLHWPFALTWIMAATGSFIAEACFLSQIWTLSRKNKALTGMIAFASLAQYAFSLVFFANMIKRIDTDVVIATDRNRIPVILQQVFAIISNSTIVAALCIYNYRPNQRNLGGASIVDGLLTILFERGLLSGLLQMVYLLVYVLSSQTFLWFPFQVATSKLLVNAILAKLNSRETKVLKKETVGLTLSHIGTRSMMHANERVSVVTTKTSGIGSEAPSFSSNLKEDLEGQS